MKKLLILTIVLLPIICCSQDFKSFNWGDPVEKVKKAESNLENIISLSSWLAYETTIALKDAQLNYCFEKNKLSSVNYTFKEIHTNANLYIEDYNDIKNLLIKKYGEPTKQKEEWKGTLWKDNPEHKGMAVAMGDLSISAFWDTEKTFIVLFLVGDNGKIHHTLGYESKEYGKHGSNKDTGSEVNNDL